MPLFGWFSCANPLSRSDDVTLNGIGLSEVMVIVMTFPGSYGIGLGPELNAIVIVGTFGGAGVLRLLGSLVIGVQCGAGALEAHVDWGMQLVAVTQNSVVSAMLYRVYEFRHGWGSTVCDSPVLV